MSTEPYESISNDNFASNSDVFKTNISSNISTNNENEENIPTWRLFIDYR